jgi:hypothetical protein
MTYTIQVVHAAAIAGGAAFDGIGASSDED